MEINYKNDVLFKYTLSNETDKDCQFLLKLIINEIIGIEYQYFHIINPDILPEKLLDKDIILDILIKDNEERLILKCRSLHSHYIFIKGFNTMVLSYFLLNEIYLNHMITYMQFIKLSL